ncbi:MAG: GTPase Era, partial [Erysipelotrichaceae bacterium]|nr:GTPase Era [Erysipelotrichaceae bacterium]
MKSGFIALIGRPNAGKSTLMNNLLNQKIAIISPKAQTTRNQIRGILTDEDSQMIFIDTPGIHKPQHTLGQQMNKEAFSAMGSVDLIYFLVDATQEFGKGDQFVLDILAKQKLPVFLLVNKIDLLSKDQVMETLLRYNKLFDFKEIIPISAKEGFNIEELLATTKNYLEDGIMYYPKDQVC